MDGQDEEDTHLNLLYSIPDPAISIIVHAVQRTERHGGIRVITRDGDRADNLGVVVVHQCFTLQAAGNSRRITV